MLYTQKMSGHSLHEDFDRRQEGHGSSDRGFGIVISISFALVGLLPLRANHPVRWWALALGGLFLIVAFLQPVWLRRLNRVWTKLGFLHRSGRQPGGHRPAFLSRGHTHRIPFSPAGKDPLRLALDAGVRSYWIERRLPGPLPETMSNQF